MQRERDIEKRLREAVKRAGGIAYKWVSPGNAGVPDRIVILPGRAPVFVELKTETGKLSTLQIAQIKRLVGMGQTVRVVRGRPGLEELLKELGI